MGVRWYLRVDLTCISLMDKDVENFLKYLLAGLMFSDTAVYPSRFGILIGTGVVSYDIFVEFFLLAVSFFVL